MQKKIWKQTLELHYGEYNVEFPKGTEIVNIEIIGEELSIWGMFESPNASEPLVSIPICITYTGKRFNERYNKYLKTIVTDAGIWHILTEKCNGVFDSDTILDDEDVELYDKPVHKKYDTCINGCPIRVHAQNMCRHCYDKARRNGDIIVGDMYY